MESLATEGGAVTFRLWLCLFVGLFFSQLGLARPHASACSPIDKWVRASVNELVSSAHSAYENDTIDTYNDVVGQLTRTMKRCGLDRDTNFAAAYPELAGYLDQAAYAVQPSHELGFNVPDRQYLTETAEYVKIPDYLLDQRFLHDVSRYETLRRAKQYLAGLNSTRDAGSQLIFFSYTSRHLGTPDNDNSYRRLLVIVPGTEGEPDKWVQFGVTDPGVKVRTRNVSIVTAMPREGGTYDAYFRDVFRTFRRDGTITLRGRFELGEGEDNCASCHKSGVLPIFPEAGSAGRGEDAAVEAANARFRSYGPPRFGGYLDAAKFGPGLSSATSEYREAKFGRAFGHTDIGNAMQCDRCHVPENLGYLNWPMDSTIISSFIEGGAMPRNVAITSAHRSELYSKLIKEYFDVSDRTPGVMKS